MWDTLVYILIFAHNGQFVFLVWKKLLRGARLLLFVVCLCFFLKKKEYFKSQFFTLKSFYRPAGNRRHLKEDAPACTLKFNNMLTNKTRPSEMEVSPQTFGNFLQTIEYLGIIKFLWIIMTLKSILRILLKQNTALLPHVCVSWTLWACP